MAQKQVAARTEGDVFQGMFFWHQAVPLLRSSSLVQRVVLEHDEAAGVDDVAVFFGSPGIVDAGRMCTADFFQCKYHVDRSSEYSASNFIDPNFIGAKGSLLQRFHGAHEKLKKMSHGWYRLHLVSNWHWASADAVGPLLRESFSGALPDRFFSDGPRSALGTVREQWRTHLGLDGAAFEDFARRLRFGVNYFARREFRAWLSDRLARHGLLDLPEDKEQSAYDTLAQQFVMNGTTDFDPSTFRAMCEREGLLGPKQPLGVPRVGIRSFMRFAERMEDETDRFVCVAKHFDGRHIRAHDSWSDQVAQDVRAFLADHSLRADEHHLLLDCHSSLAFLAGYELDRKSGAQVFPVQKGVRTEAWKPSSTSVTTSNWVTATSQYAPNSKDVAVAVSVTHDSVADVKRYVAESGLDITALVDVRPSAGIGARAISDADHAVALADKLASIIRASGAGGAVHLFTAAPNALLYFLGQHRAGLGTVQLYEFDFESERGGSYSPSFRVPLA